MRRYFKIINNNYDVLNIGTCDEELRLTDSVIEIFEEEYKFLLNLLHDPQPTEIEKLRADMDYILMLQGEV